MSCFRQTSVRLGAMLLLTVLLFSASAFADTKVTQASAALYFQLGDEQAWVDSSRSYALNHHANVPFAIKWDTTGPGNIGVVRAKIEFDATKLEVISVTDEAAWTGDFEYSVTTAGSTGYLYLDFTAGSLSPPANFTDLAEIVFKAKCQQELSVNALEFIDNYQISFIMADYNVFYPATGNWDDGTVTIHDYVGIIDLPDEEFSGSLGETVWVDIDGTCNFSTYSMQMCLQYDHTKLAIVGISVVGDIFQNVYVFGAGAGAKKLLFLDYGDATAPGALEFTDEAFVSVQFELLCDLADAPSSLTLLADSCFWHPARSRNCSALEQIGPDWTDVGSISAVDTAGFGGYFEGDLLSVFDGPFDVDLVLTSYNSFVAGAIDAVDPLIVMNLTLGDDFTYVSDSGALAFNDITTEQGHNLSLKLDTSAVPAMWQPSATLVDRHVVTLEWDTASYTPTWMNRVLDAPELVSIFADVPDSAAMTDTLGCFRATVGNGTLTLGDIDPLEVGIGRFGAEEADSNACPKHDLMIQANFDIDSFFVRIDVRPNTSVTANGVDVGVTATQIDDSTITLSSAGKWDYNNPGSLKKVCELEYGTSLAYGIDVDLRFSQESIFESAPNDSHFVELALPTVVVEPKISCPGRMNRPPFTENEALDNPEDPDRDPTEFTLHQNFPNPFNPVTSISFDLPLATEWRLTVYNIAGQRIDEFSGSASPGRVNVEWDGSPYASGVYLYRLEAGEFATTKKMLLIK